MPYDFTLETTLPASPEAIFSAWMSSEGHAAMTGGPATVDGRVGGAFSAWGGYIHGLTTALEPAARIAQSWRTGEFAAGDADSHIELLLSPTEEGTRLTLHHRNVPDGQTQYEERGWEEHYFAPMRRYFGTDATAD